MCKGAKTRKRADKTEKTDAPKTEDDQTAKSKEAARIARYKENLAARSPPTVYRPDDSSERALAKIPGFDPTCAPNTSRREGEEKADNNEEWSPKQEKQQKMDTPRASPAESREECSPTITAEQQQAEIDRLRDEHRALREENSALREGLQELRWMVQNLTHRLSVVEQQGNLLHNDAIDTTDSLRRLRRKVDWMAEDLAVEKNEFDLGRYDV